MLVIWLPASSGESPSSSTPSFSFRKKSKPCKPDCCSSKAPSVKSGKEICSQLYEFHDESSHLEIVPVNCLLVVNKHNAMNISELHW